MKTILYGHAWMSGALTAFGFYGLARAFNTTRQVWVWVAIVAIISGCINGIVKMRYQHAERMEMIRHGINPDFDGGKSTVPPEV